MGINKGRCDFYSDSINASVYSSNTTLKWLSMHIRKKIKPLTLTGVLSSFRVSQTRFSIFSRRSSEIIYRFGLAYKEKIGGGPYVMDDLQQLRPAALKCFLQQRKIVDNVAQIQHLRYPSSGRFSRIGNTSF